jgi:hypothetical protein
MTVAPSVSPDRSRWPLGRLVLLILALGFLGLAGDLRMEHVDVVREQVIAWTPILYSLLMGVASLLTVVFWRRVTRRILMALFVLGFIVGGLGFYLHNRDNLDRPFQVDVGAWTNPHMRHPHGPPANAPLTFAGLALLGILTLLERYSRTRSSDA